MRTQVVNNCQGPHYIQCPNAGKFPGPLVILQPGLNLIDSKQLAELRKNPGVERLFNTKIPVSKAVEADPRTFGKPMLETRGKELEDKAPLASLPLKEAIAIIELTEDTDLLNEWREVCEPTKQSDLIKALNARIKEIASGIDASTAAAG